MPRISFETILSRLKALTFQQFAAFWRRAFIWSIYVGIGTVVGFAWLLLMDVVAPVIGGGNMGFDSVWKVLYYGPLFLLVTLVPVTIPLIALMWMLTSFFAEDNLGRRHGLLATIALLVGGLAVLYVLPEDVCYAVIDGFDPALPAMNDACVDQMALLVWDEFWKGAIGDFFEIVQVETSDLRIDHIGPVGRLYMFIFRLLSAAFTLSIVLGLRNLFRRKSKPEAAA